jgi:hypothetical protein
MSKENHGRAPRLAVRRRDWRRDEKAIAALLKRGADIHAINEDGQTAIEIAHALGVSRLLEPGAAAS